ncbi:hypothetical protein [Mobilicoccus pelagius]|uniref:Bacteriocin biosynthesis cyclodehydratase domain-containing protein n=1 Tax=Mobilicoccus pelagius NBRC 104925 TaxID=1089455 RepID=H5URR2_9MICO|nr:hypothetical protein [Mobilicoccus pelagius]GAB48420.1 hypothetical protein MOPEL_073_00600 [Mobilicoccus pelagius NBRC 104925]
MFPSLPPHVPLLRRGPAELQLGLEPDGVVLDGLTTTEISVLTGLDGSSPLKVAAARTGRSAARFSALVEDLAARGLVDDAHATPAVGRTVAIDGEGATTTLLADLLRAEGVHVVHGRAVLDDLDLALRGRRPTLVGDHVDVLVRVAAGALSPVAARHDGVECLPVLVRHRSVTVGPLVTHDGPCLFCLDLTRADDDPWWGHVLAQVEHLREPADPSPATVLAASLACARLLDRFTSPPGRTSVAESTTVLLPGGRSRHREWRRHPRCPRHDDAHDVGGSSPPPVAGADPGRCGRGGADGGTPGTPGCATSGSTGVAGSTARDTRRAPHARHRSGRIQPRAPQ